MNGTTPLRIIISNLFASSQDAPQALQALVAEVVAPSIPNCPFETTAPTHDLPADERQELLNLLSNKLLDAYSSSIPEHLQSLLTDEAFIATLLLLPRQEEFFSILRAENVVPALLLLLTYSGMQRGSVSLMLTRVLIKRDGVYHFIKNLSKGEDRLMMKALAVQVLISLPRNLPASQYIEGVLTQMLDMLINYECDPWFQSIIAEATTRLIQKKPELCSMILHDKLVRQLQTAEDMTGVSRAYKALLSYEPPHSLLLYSIEANFATFVGLIEFAFRYTILQTSRGIVDSATQFLKHSQFAHTLVFNWIVSEAYEVPYFTSDSEGKIVRSERTEDLESLAALVWLTSRIESSPGIVQFYSKLFTKLLAHFSEDCSIRVTSLILALAEKANPAELVASPSQLEVFLTHLLKSDDLELLQGALGMLVVMLESSEFVSEDKHFLLEITPRVKELAGHEDSLISTLAQRTDQGISEVILPLEGQTKRVAPEPATHPIDANSSPFTKALELHMLSLSDRDVAWSEVASYIDDPDLFVFENFVKLVVAKVDILEVCDALQAYANSPDSKLKAIEILYRYLTSPLKRSLLKAKGPLEVFTRVALSTTEDSQLLLSALSLAAALFKKFGDSCHNLLHDALHCCLSTLKLSTSRLYTKQPPPPHLSGALSCMKAIIAYTSIELLADYIQEIKTTLALLLEVCPEEDPCKVLLDSAIRAYDSKLSSHIEV
mmetsp:Transcript_23841/g.42219  ORF Transcript_23841/g.42219 Transcript_23841/m.42219 type:complete len:720 (-) Transcript_23841:66-2225(-)